MNSQCVCSFVARHTRLLAILCLTLTAGLIFSAPWANRWLSTQEQEAAARLIRSQALSGSLARERLQLARLDTLVKHLLENRFLPFAPENRPVMTRPPATLSDGRMEWMELLHQLQGPYQVIEQRYALDTSPAPQPHLPGPRFLRSGTLRIEARFPDESYFLAWMEHLLRTPFLQITPRHCQLEMLSSPAELLVQCRLEWHSFNTAAIPDLK